MKWNQREKDLQHQASTDSKEKQPLSSQGEDSIEKVLPEGHTEECLTLHPPQYRGDSTSEDEDVQVPAAKGKYTDLTPTPIPRDELASMDEEGSGKRRRQSWVCHSPRNNS